MLSLVAGEPRRERMLSTKRRPLLVSGGMSSFPAAAPERDHDVPFQYQEDHRELDWVNCRPGRSPGDATQSLHCRPRRPTSADDTFQSREPDTPPFYWSWRSFGFLYRYPSRILDANVEGTYTQRIDCELDVFSNRRELSIEGMGPILEGRQSPWSAKTRAKQC